MFRLPGYDHKYDTGQIILTADGVFAIVGIELAGISIGSEPLYHLRPRSNSPLANHFAETLWCHESEIIGETTDVVPSAPESLPGL